MPTLDTLTRDLLVPTESALRAAGKAPGWLEAAAAETPVASWDWFDAAAPAGATRGLEVIECPLPDEVLRSLFGAAAPRLQ